MDLPGKIKANLLVKVAGVIGGKTNACRNLTRLIKRTPDTVLDIPISVCKVTIALRKPLRRVEVFWPCIKMSDWCKYLVEFKPEFLLAGHTLSGNDGDWRTTFKQFWWDYERICPDHPLYSSDFDRGGCIPYFIHGDEGRGQLKRPYLVLAWQCAIGHGGIGTINDDSNLGFPI